MDISESSYEDETLEPIIAKNANVLEQVRKLTVINGERLHSMAGVSAFVGLEELNLSCNSIEEITDFGGLVALRVLNLSSNFIRDLPDLSTLSSLRHLILSSNKIASMAKLAAFAARPSALEHIDLADNRLYELKELRAIEGITTLRSVVFERSIQETNPFCAARKRYADALLALTNISVLCVDGLSQSELAQPRQEKTESQSRIAPHWLPSLTQINEEAQSGEELDQPTHRTWADVGSAIGRSLEPERHWRGGSLQQFAVSRTEDQITANVRSERFWHQRAKSVEAIMDETKVPLRARPALPFAQEKGIINENDAIILNAKAEFAAKLCNWEPPAICCEANPKDKECEARIDLRDKERNDESEKESLSFQLAEEQKRAIAANERSLLLSVQLEETQAKLSQSESERRLYQSEGERLKAEIAELRAALNARARPDSVKPLSEATKDCLILRKEVEQLRANIKGREELLVEYRRAFELKAAELEALKSSVDKEQRIGGFATLIRELKSELTAARAKAKELRRAAAEREVRYGAELDARQAALLAMRQRLAESEEDARALIEELNRRKRETKNSVLRLGRLCQ